MRRCSDAEPHEDILGHRFFRSGGAPIASPNALSHPQLTPAQRRLTPGRPRPWPEEGVSPTQICELLARI